jgi:hypothetical protein
MADLQKLLFETPARVSDREILVTARLNACVKAFAGQEFSDDVMDRINAAVTNQADRLIVKAHCARGRTGSLSSLAAVYMWRSEARLCSNSAVN